MATSFTWPVGLPSSPLMDYQEERNLNVIYTPMDAGPPKMRRRSQLPDTISVNYILTETEVATLDTFVFTTISGTNRFSYNHPRTGASEEVRIVPQGSSMYSISSLGNDLYRVSLVLQILP